MKSLVGMFLPLFCVLDLERSNGLMPAARELMMLSRLLIVSGVENAMLNIGVNLGLLILRPRGSMVLQGSHLHLFKLVVADTEGSIFCVKPSIPSLRGPGGGLAVPPAEKATLLGSQFDIKQCREQFVTPLSCFSQFRCNSLTFRTSVLLHLLNDLDTYGGVEPLGVFLLFLKKVADTIAPNLSIIFHMVTRLGSFPE